MIEKMKKKEEKIEKVAREDHDKTGLVRIIWDYEGVESSNRFGRKYESWVKPEIAEIYKKKMSANSPSRPQRCPVEVK